MSGSGFAAAVFSKASDLVGARVNQALMRDNQGDPELYLVREDGVILRVSTEGDCCAHAFIQHVSNADALNLATINEVENIETTQTHDDDEIAYTDTWGHRIQTSRGTVTIECRTEHNGYYSGWCNVDVVTELPAGCVPLEDF
jgi:hypothetical protein